MNDSIYDVAIIGAGASGLMLAANLDMRYSSGVILEGTSFVGSKLLMSGGGRCNITHGGSVKEFVSAYGDAGPKLRKCLYKHNNEELISWLERSGVSTTEEDGRVFPESMKARDVLDALLSESKNNNWKIEKNAKVCSVNESADGKVIIELTSGVSLKARYIVIATGGVTYPETGSDGSMLRILSDMNYAVKKPEAALAPVYVKEYPYEKLSGISVKDVSVTIAGKESGNSAERQIIKMKGDLLFTHEGFSGPVILNISKYAEKGRILSIRYDKEFEELPRRMQNILKDRSRSESGDVKTKMLRMLLENDKFEVEAVSDRGMVTSGGVCLEEVDLRSMRCRKCDSMYIIGESLDADGITGGYNLQMCWSTACSCAEALKKELQTGTEVRRTKE